MLVSGDIKLLRTIFKAKTNFASEVLFAHNKKHKCFYTANLGDAIIAGDVYLRKYDENLDFVASVNIPISISLIRTQDALLYDEDENSFWIFTTNTTNALRKLQITDNGASISVANIIQVPFNYNTIGSAVSVRASILRETVDDIYFNVCGVDNLINDLYQVNKSTGATVAKTSMSAIAPSFDRSFGMIHHDNCTYVNTLGYGLSGTPTIMIKYDWIANTQTLLQNFGATRPTDAYHKVENNKIYAYKYGGGVVSYITRDLTTGALLETIRTSGETNINFLSGIGVVAYGCFTTIRETEASFFQVGQTSRNKLLVSGDVSGGVQTTRNKPLIQI